MSEIKVPLLLCIPDAEKAAAVMIKFDEWQQKYHHCRFNRPFYLESKAPEVRNISQDTEQQLVNEVNQEMASNSDIKGHLG